MNNGHTLDVLHAAYPDLAQTMDRLMKRGRMPHAILVHGPDGVGKRTVCHGWTYQLLGGFDTFDAMIDALNDDHPVIRHIMNGTHPELYTVPCPASIKDVRRVLGQLGQTAWSVAQRVVVIPRIDQLNVACMNALLKIIETPPDRTLFLMTASGPVMKTVASRCMRVSMQPLPPHRMPALPMMTETPDLGLALSLHEDGPEHQWNKKAEPSLYDQMTQGCIGRAYTLHDGMPWAEQGWAFITGNATAPTVPSGDWMDQAKHHMPVWKELMTLWGHKVSHAAYTAGKLHQWDIVWKECCAIMDASAVFHNNAALTIMTVCEKIGVFCRNHTLKP